MMRRAGKIQERGLLYPLLPISEILRVLRTLSPWCDQKSKAENDVKILREGIFKQCVFTFYLR